MFSKVSLAIFNITRYINTYLYFIFMFTVL